ncbi:cysteine protease [Dorcoceras hygrometricum]|uniref:Cysteine protease n=1 Tax=Dorcoceras hygrometricum TaxID=472368 RepID=A0A2Z7C365_9LAMI|nr:cysteine protease [Dorcoceras hygrometricum]
MCEANQLDYVLRSLLKKKKIQVISTADESVSSRKDISTVDESINSRYPRSKKKKIAFIISHTVEAVVHLWSLGVLTAAGCGIGSVHAVVRSNLLVEPSEVEEGEM